MGKGYKTLFTPQPIGKRYKYCRSEHIGESGQAKIISRQCNGVGHDEILVKIILDGSMPNLYAIHSLYDPVKMILYEFLTSHPLQTMTFPCAFLCAVYI